MKRSLLLWIVFGILLVPRDPIVAHVYDINPVQYGILESANQDFQASGNRNIQPLPIAVFTWKYYSYKDDIVHYDQKTRRSGYHLYQGSLNLQNSNLVVPCNRDP